MRFMSAVFILMLVVHAAAGDETYKFDLRLSKAEERVEDLDGRVKAIEDRIAKASAKEGPVVRSIPDEPRKVTPLKLVSMPGLTDPMESRIAALEKEVSALKEKCEKCCAVPAASAGPTYIQPGGSSTTVVQPPPVFAPVPSQPYPTVSVSPMMNGVPFSNGQGCSSPPSNYVSSYSAPSGIIYHSAVPYGNVSSMNIVSGPGQVMQFSNGSNCANGRCRNR